MCSVTQLWKRCRDFFARSRRRRCTSGHWNYFGARENRSGLPTKKVGMMLRLGETREEVLAAMEDMRETAKNSSILTLGQYIRPSARATAPSSTTCIERSSEGLERLGETMGFKHVENWAAGAVFLSCFRAGRSGAFVKNGCSNPALPAVIYAASEKCGRLLVSGTSAAKRDSW